MPEPAPSSAPTPPRGRVRRAAGWAGRGVGRGARWAGRTWRAWAQSRWSAVRDAERPAPWRALHGAWLAGGLGATLGAAVSALVLLYALVLVPFTPGVRSLRAAHEADPTVVLSADGETLTAYARRGRDWVELDAVAEPVVQALIATEDRRFYRHPGVDPIRTVGAVLRTIGGSPQGGSTITQQLARNLFPERIGRRASLTRKLKEAITAVKIEAVYDKATILEIYLNSVPFLYDAVGIERAAQTYFSTSAAELDPAQAATLVGMLKGTSLYNPRRHPERARARRDLVLSLMEQQGALTPEEADRWRAAPLALRFERQPIRNSAAPYFTEHVRVWLERWCRSNGCNPYGDGLRVHTTLDARLQRQATASAETFGRALQAVADVEWSSAALPRLGTTTTPYVKARRAARPWAHFFAHEAARVDALVRATPAFRRAVAAGREPGPALDSLRRAPAFMDSLRARATRLEVAFTAVDPATGHVKAWVGGRDFRTSAYDRVARARRQPGSTFKPFLYARALEEGWAPDDTVPDEAVEIALAGGRVWAPRDPGGPSGERLTLRDGLARSKNTIAARLVDAVGARDVARLARRVGVESELDAVPSLALGTSDVSLLEMTGAYATFAAGGVRREPTFVARIEAADGTVLADFAPEPRQALAPETALAVVDMMRGVVDGGTGRQVRTAFDVRGDLAGKTGTTQDGADGWFFLLHPDLVMGAWVGFDSPTVTFRSAYWEQGGHNALRVVGETAERAQRAGALSRTARFETPAFRPRGGALRRFQRWLGDALGGERPAEPPPVPEPDPAPRNAERVPAPDGGEAARIAEQIGRGLERESAAAGRSLRGLQARLREAERWADDALREPDPEVRRRIERVAREIEREAESVAREIERALR